MKLNSKFSLALIALVGIGVFALPATTALFSGQHSFYNIDATGNQIPCTKCHGDVKAELSSGLSTTTGTPGPHANFKCEYCHRAESGFASGDDAYAKVLYQDSNGSSLGLVTTIQNYEQGNFPKVIVYQAGMTVDNWQSVTLAVQDKDGNQFYNNTDFLNDFGTYDGSLDTFGTVGDTYSYSYTSETSLYNSTTGQPKDTNTATQNGGFNPRAVTWTASNKENLTGAGSREHTPGTRYHAASLVSCLECHGGDQNKGAPGYQVTSPEPYNHAGWLVDPTDPNSKCQNCHYGNAPGTPSWELDLEAGGFGLTDYPNDTGEVEAHRNWVMTNQTQNPNANVNDTMSRNGYGASNDACVACHTHVAVEINFKKGYLLNFNATESATGNYTVSNFNIQGTVNVTTYGNASGNTFAVSNSTYAWQPINGTLYINGTASNITVVGLGTNGTSTNDSAAALSSGQ